MGGLPGSKAFELGRPFYLGVFLTALVVLFYEIVLFQALHFVSNYMTAIQVVGVALLGISVGGLLAFGMRRHASPEWFVGCTLGIPVLLVLAFASLVFFSGNPWVNSIALMLPFVGASMVISMGFSLAPSHKVYFVDLSGAALGAILACLSVPLLREEGSWLVIMLFSLGAAYVFSELVAEPKRTRYQKTAKAGALAVVVLLAIHLPTDFLNLGRIVRGDQDKSKIFSYWRRVKNNPERDVKYVFSKGSLVERIDMLKTAKKNITPYYHGSPNDHSSPWREKAYVKDRRMALGLIKDPDVLVIGTAAEGIVKTAKIMGEGDVVGLEINSAIVKAMTKKFYKWSKKAYKDIELHVVDARSYMKRTDRKFHFITMMNTHRLRNIGYTGQPEYLHTYESMADIFDHLHDDGWVILEERDINQRARLGIQRFLQTGKAVLRDHLHQEDPSRHFWVYDWHGRSSRSRRNLYKQIYIKKTPINEKDIEFIKSWVQMQKERPKRDCKVLYLPGETTGSQMEKMILAEDPYDFYDRAKYNFDTITDDRPFPFDIFRKREHLVQVVKPTLILALLLGIFPVTGFLLFRRWDDPGAGGFKGGIGTVAFGLLAILYFSLLGIAYLMIEIVLIQKFLIFIGIPVLTLAVVLAAMLFFSGLGSYFSRNWGPKKQVSAFLGIFLMALGLHAVVDGFVDHLIFLPVVFRVALLVLLLAPISFLMGTPFPFGMALVKDRLNDRFGAAMFGLNGAFSALATPLALSMAVIYGFNVTYLAGVSVYAGCLVLALLLSLWVRTREAE